QSELDVNFPQLHKLSKLGSCASGMEGYNRMYNPDYTHTYEPEVIDDIRVNTRELLCKFEEDDAKGPGYLCRYTTALSYYTHKPDSNFKVNGDIVPQNAVGIAKSWIDRTFVVSEIETAFDRLPEWLSDLSYKDGKYIIGFSGCGCSGSVGVSPVTIDGVLHLKVTSEASLMCS
ncbi:MAG: hypothetical protein P8H03_06290, partial [Emcibacteraceae bacterium]|nr:hypothetical protein [Emcibacteraceae bacterium]